MLHKMITFSKTEAWWELGLLTINFPSLLPPTPRVMHCSQHFLEMPRARWFLQVCSWGPILQPPDPQVIRQAWCGETWPDRSIKEKTRGTSGWFHSPTSKLADDLDRSYLYLNERINLHRHPEFFPHLISSKTKAVYARQCWQSQAVLITALFLEEESLSSAMPQFHTSLRNSSPLFSTGQQSPEVQGDGKTVSS